MGDIFSQLKKNLEQMRTSLGKIEKEFENEYFDFNFENIIILITECITHLPVKKLNVKSNAKVNKGSTDIKASIKVQREDKQQLEIILFEENKLKENSCLFLEKIRNFLISRKIELKEFREMFEFSNEEFIPKEEFSNTLKIILNSISHEEFFKKEEIIDFVDNFNKTKKNKELINFKKFIEKLKKVFDRKRLVYDKSEFKKEKNAPMDIDNYELSLQKYAKLKTYIHKFYDSNLRFQCDYEIRQLVLKLKIKYDPIIAHENSEEFELYVKKSIKIFNQPKYMVKTIKIIIFY